jgi:hypothetical protein
VHPGTTVRVFPATCRWRGERRCGLYRWISANNSQQPHEPPQQPPPVDLLGITAPAPPLPPPAPRPVSATVDSNRTVSSCPAGHGVGAVASLIGRCCSNVAPQLRHRYSYRGIFLGYRVRSPGGRRTYSMRGESGARVGRVSRDRPATECGARATECCRRATECGDRVTEYATWQ